MGLLTPLPFQTEQLLLKQNLLETLPYNDEVQRKIIALAKIAKKEGFDSISFLCNTIHAWRSDEVVQATLEELQLPWVSLMDATVEVIKKEHPKVTKIGVLGTDGTLQTGLYTKAITDAGLTPVNLDLGSPEQQSVMDAIYKPPYGIKTSGAEVTQQATDQLCAAADYLKTQGAQVIVGGCTEIPLALNGETYTNLAVIDPLEALAKVHLQQAMNA